MFQCFRNRVKKEINSVFTQVVLLLAELGFVSLDVEYIDVSDPQKHSHRGNISFPPWESNIPTVGMFLGAGTLPTLQRQNIGKRCNYFNLLLSVINVSVQTVDIVNNLPKLKFE